MRALELYFHIPFCVKKCLYCDFLSAPADEETKRRYMEALLTETVGNAPRYAGCQVSSIFIGGGTPSAVSPVYIERLLEAVRGHYRLAADAELTMEVNPGTVTERNLADLRRAGINRLSVGLQSADNEELADIGRIHTWEDFTEAYEAAVRVGFDNINVDIMSALPGQTLPKYRGTLRRVLALRPQPEHISAYSLILEEGTPLYERYRKGKLKLPDEDTDREMYQETKEILARAGYHRYEISNYAKAGYECRHNCGYWRRRDYIGFGIGAASLAENVRFSNARDLERYLASPMECRVEEHVLSREEQMEEFMFLGLRMTSGVDLTEFKRIFGIDADAVYGAVIRKNIREGLLRYLPRRGDGPERESGADRAVEESGDAARLALTDKGLDVSNYVMAQFLLEIVGKF